MVKQSLCRPGQAPELQEVEAPLISRQSAHEGRKFVSAMHRLPLPPGHIPGTHFILQNSGFKTLNCGLPEDRGATPTVPRIHCSFAASVSSPACVRLPLLSSVKLVMNKCEFIWNGYWVYNFFLSLRIFSINSAQKYERVLIVEKVRNHCCRTLYFAYLNDPS